MPSFTQCLPNTTTTWCDYYCNNPSQADDREKNAFFLNNFLNVTQKGWVAAILREGDNRYNNRLTEYRKITQFFLRHLPDMAFNLSGGGGYGRQYKPLLQMGRVNSSDGKIDHDNAFRLHYIADTGFILITSDAVILSQRNPKISGIEHNPLNDFIPNPDLCLGRVTLTDREIRIEENDQNDINTFLDEFNDRNKQVGHAEKFIWGYEDCPFIPLLMQQHRLESLLRKKKKKLEDKTISKRPATTNMNNLNTILYGPPGTGKTYELSTRATKIIEGPTNNESRDHINKRFSELQREGRIEFTTFHQNYSYEDFIEGLRAEYKEKSVVYDIEPGILKRIAYRALYAWLTGKPADFENDPAQKDTVLKYLRSGDHEDEKKPEKIPNYVLIIDEINRGNVARIFGELITLVEDSKRARRPGESDHGHQPLLATLPYTKEPFILPPNLYLIGTMSTADRSLISLDAALRRRFFFEEMPPKPQELENRVIDGVNLENFLTQLNQRIMARDVKDHCIGHAYFMEVETLADLANVMRYKVIPQLQEYFHDSPGDLHQLLQFGNDSLNGSFVDQDGQTKEACLTNPSSYQNFRAP